MNEFFIFHRVTRFNPFEWDKDENRERTTSENKFIKRYKWLNSYLETLYERLHKLKKLFMDLIVCRIDDRYRDSVYYRTINITLFRLLDNYKCLRYTGMIHRCSVSKRLMYERLLLFYCSLYRFTRGI